MQYILATDTDANVLADLRVTAMRPSLAAVGRFDPVRARQRFLKTFDPQQTWKIEQNAALIGFFVLIENADYLYLDHLYLVDLVQRTGIGRQVLDHIKGQAATKKNQFAFAPCLIARPISFIYKTISKKPTVKILTYIMNIARMPSRRRGHAQRE